MSTYCATNFSPHHPQHVARGKRGLLTEALNAPNSTILARSNILVFDTDVFNSSCAFVVGRFLLPPTRRNLYCCRHQIPSMLSSAATVPRATTTSTSLLPQIRLHSSRGPILMGVVRWPPGLAIGSVYNKGIA